MMVKVEGGETLHIINFLGSAYTQEIINCWVEKEGKIGVGGWL